MPADNPFVKMPGARPEIWAYGLRNPWKMSFDRATGDLWVGDVGWEMWEMVYRVRKGGNYGWSIMEGPQTVHPLEKIGPTPILKHDLYFSHADAASITGGYVYHGKRFPELAGVLHLRRLDDVQSVEHTIRRRQGRIAQGNRPGPHAQSSPSARTTTASCISLAMATNDGIYRLGAQPGSRQRQRNFRGS